MRPNLNFWKRSPTSQKQCLEIMPLKYTTKTYVYFTTTKILYKKISTIYNILRSWDVLRFGSHFVSKIKKNIKQVQSTTVLLKM